MTATTTRTTTATLRHFTIAVVVSLITMAVAMVNAQSQISPSFSQPTTSSISIVAAAAAQENHQRGGSEQTQNKGMVVSRVLQEFNCSDYISSQIQNVLDQAKDPVALGNTVCSANAQMQELSILLNPEAFFTRAKFGEFAECAKTIFLESNAIYKETSTNGTTRLSNSTTCKTEVSTFATEIIANQDNLFTDPNASQRRRQLIVLLTFVLLALGAMIGPVIIELSVELTAEAIARARTSCTASNQCSRNRCCRNNAKNERVCIIKPAIRRNRERLCLP